jgi:hypothetical protein
VKTSTTELLNLQELSRLVSSASPNPGHGPLLAALEERYPSTPFRIIQERGRTWAAGIIDKAGRRVTEDLGKWIDEELKINSGNAKAVWKKYKNAGFKRTEWVGSVIYLTAPFGADPDAFYQLEIQTGTEMTTQDLFDASTAYPPEDRWELISGHYQKYADSEREILAPARYEVTALTNVRRSLRELVELDRVYRSSRLPELEKKVVRVQELVLGEGGYQSAFDIPLLELCPGLSDRLPAGYRLFQDWRESSAGQGGHKFCDHWWLEMGGWTEADGSKRLSFIPQWAEADGGMDLPEISPSWEASPYGVMESLVQFDRLVGYPFAWYFYMLHGNRVTASAGGVIANAVKDGVIRLPACDEAVLLRWRQDQYGF